MTCGCRYLVGDLAHRMGPGRSTATGVSGSSCADPVPYTDMFFLQEMWLITFLMSYSCFFLVVGFTF